MMSINRVELLERVTNAFPPVEMPAREEIAYHGDVCDGCADLTEDLEEFRYKKTNGSLIRLVYQEMTHLSAKAWRWLLPEYLRFCLTPEAVYSRMETEFLIYNLGPDARFQEDTRLRLACLNSAQIVCLLEFLQWCLEHEFWKEYCPEHIVRAIEFLKTLRSADASS